MRYYHISTGLRGCYMPDNSYVIAVKTRRELKSYLESEAYSIRDSGMVGCSKRAIQWLAATQWRDKKNHLPYVAEYGNDRKNYCFGIFISPATKKEFWEYVEENANN